MWNMKALSFTIQELWPMLNIFVNKQTNRLNDRAVSHFFREQGTFILGQKKKKNHEDLITQKIINSLPNDKILDESKLKQIADDILKCI